MASKPPPGFKLPPPPAGGLRKSGSSGGAPPPPLPKKASDANVGSPPSPAPSSPHGAQPSPPPIPQKRAPPAIPQKPGGGGASPAPPAKRNMSSSSSADPGLDATSLPLPAPPVDATSLPLPAPPVDATALPLPKPPIDDDEPSDPETLKRIAYEKRRKIVGEILSTEDGYVKALDYMVNAYMHPLVQMAETELLPNRTKAEIKKIFSNVEQLLPINKHLKNSIEERVNNWHETQLIGDIFLKMAQFFKMYNTYGNNYDEASDTLDKCQQDPQFKEIEEGIAAGTDLVSLSSMLIMPIQRIPRYNLLLSDFLRKTPPDHPDHTNISQALTSFEDVMQYLDANITKAENVKKYMAITKIKGGDRIIQAHRVLIADGILHLKSKKQGDGKGTIKMRLGSKIKEAKLQIWLFNDVMIHLKKSISKKRDISSTEYTWPLELIWIKDNKEQDIHDPKMPYSFILVGPRKTYTVRFVTVDEKVKWMNTIKSAVSKVLNDENAPDDHHRYGHYKFPKEEGEYEGWWKFGRIHGDGVFTFFGNKYSGEWEYNCKSGNGTFELVTGEFFHGEWKEDKPHGFGTLNYTNGDKYEGEWREGLRCGKGSLTYANGDKYDGEWRENVPWGEGVYTTATGFIYNGGWVMGKLSNYGCLIAPNGRRYEGQFLAGQKVGEGKMDFANGDFYIGQWKEDKPNGFGIYHSAVEGLYEGMFHNSLREGQGKMLFKNGDRYDGQWKRNQFNGNGTLISASGAIDRYEGQWENGKHNGKGILYYRSGARYEGQFKDDIPHGNGIYISANAVVFDGKWDNGRREGKAVIAIGPNKHSHTVHGNMMSEGEKSFMIVPDVPAIHLEL